MENAITEKRGLVIILVIATIIIFIGLVWVIVTYLPWNQLGFPGPSITSTARTEMNCTYPVTYWKLHPELYPPQVVIGEETFSGGELEAILSVETQDTTQKLKAELAAAFLNMLSGADQSSIEMTVFQAFGWLAQHPAGSRLTDVEREQGNRLSNVLEAYNLGLTGVAPCELSNTLSLTETPTPTSTVITTTTPTQTISPTPSGTITPFELTATATFFYILPSRTPTLTYKPPVGPSSTPYPSDTPVPPTERPTNTPIPPTPTFTLPPPTLTLPPEPTETPQ